jgi:RimJ/RimL family protein N-acetyltransferase
MKCATASGYTIEGRQRQQMYKNGVYLDLVYVGLLREDWKA